MKRHYSPRARTVILSWADEADLFRQVTMLAPTGPVFILAHRNAPGSGPWRDVAMLPREPVGYARALYGELLACDHAGASVIVVEAPPEGREWQAILDRLSRAAAID
jgi:L-threonylcarbamoyladenylate synthase